MSDIINIQDQEFSFFGEGSQIKGDFFLKGTTHLASRIEGSVEMDRETNLIIEPEGSLKGTVKCFDLELYGAFNGEIEAKGTVTIYPSAKFDGKIITKNLVVFPGATVNMTGQTLN